MPLNDFLYQLLLDHNCVIIPKVGAFVGNYNSARINNLNHKVYPPYKKLTFNKSLNQNDGLLISFWAKKKGIEYNLAEKEVKAWSVEIEETLKAQNLVEFKHVGRLFNDSLGKTRFEQSTNFNLLKDAFGLEEIIAFPKAKPKHIPQQKTSALASEKVIPIVQPVSIDKNQINYKLVSIAAAIALLFMYSWYVGFRTNLFKGGNFHFSELNPLSSKVCEIYKPRVTDKMPSFSLNEKPLKVPSDKDFMSFSLYYPEENNSDETKVVSLKPEDFAKPDSTKVKLNIPASIKDGFYQIVVGCFKEPENAQKFIAKLQNKGYKNSGLIDIWKGLHRVRIDAFESKQDALDALTAVKANENANAWIVRK